MIRLPKVRMALALFALLGLAFTASAEEDKGTIKSVFLDKNEVVLKGILSDTTYDINKDAKICLDGRKASGVLTDHHCPILAAHRVPILTGGRKSSTARASRLIASPM